MVYGGARWCRMVRRVPDGAVWCMKVSDGAGWCGRMQKMMQESARVCMIVPDSKLRQTKYDISQLFDKDDMALFKSSLNVNHCLRHLYPEATPCTQYDIATTWS